MHWIVYIKKNETLQNSLRTGDAIDYQICGTLFFTRLFYDSRGPRIPTFTVNIHFRGFRTHGGSPGTPFSFYPWNPWFCTRSAFLLADGAFFVENVWNLHQAASRTPLVCRLKKKNFSLTSGPKTIGILSKYWAAPISPAHGVKWYFQGLRSWKIIFVVGS